MSKKGLLNLILFLTITAIVYGIWAIQPLPFDDWFLQTTRLFNMPSIPETGQMIRYCFLGSDIIWSSPFSLFKPWSLLTAIVVISLLWAAFINEPIVVRAGLMLIAALGFPYLGHIGPWNLVASEYTVSFVWVMVWYTVFIKIRYMDTRFALRGILFFALTFIAASWHEVWLVTFFGIAVYFIFDAFSLLKKRDQPFRLRSVGIHLSVILGYMLAVAFYTRGGPGKFIDARTAAPGLFTSLLNWPHAIKAFLLGIKESLVLIKDSLPIFLLIIYVRLNKNFRTKLRADFKLFLAAALGSILFTYVAAFINGAPDWRVRWLCVLSLSFALYTLPESVLMNRFKLGRSDSFVRAVRLCSVIVAAAWLSYNAYFTYIYTNIDVAGWLRYRQMVVDRNSDAKKGLGRCTLPKNRPKGVARWDHPWGAQDDRYRYFMGPSEQQVYKAIDALWDQSTKRQAQ